MDFSCYLGDIKGEFNLNQTAMEHEKLIGLQNTNVKWKTYQDTTI